MDTFHTIAKAVTQIGSVSGRNDKIALLEAHANLEGFKEVMQFIYNPYIRTGIAAAKLKKAKLGNWENITWQQIIEHFTLHQSGSDADAALAKTFISQYKPDSDTSKLAIAMVTKNLKIGVTENTLNKVYGDDFIPKIGIMKGEKYEDHKGKVSGPFIVTEKLDGVRRLIVKENGKVSIYSRSGIPDEGLVDIEAEARCLPDNSVVDGELLAIGDFPDSIALRQATNSIANSKGIRHGLTYNVFDFIALEDFKKGISTHTAAVRKTLVAAMFGDESLKHLLPDDYMGNINMFKIPYNFQFIKPVPILGIAMTEMDVLAYAVPIWERGFEGVMLNTFDGLYDLIKDRSRDLLKVKRTKTYVVKVIDIEEGKNKNTGKVGSLIFDYKGNRVGTGSGLNDLQRQQWWDKPSLIVGKLIEVESFGESTNAQGGISLNVPIFKRIKGVVE